MAVRETVRVPSSDGVSSLWVTLWKPEEEPKAVLQLVHGMTEHIGRYEELAQFLTARGVAVIGHDQLGHGRTAPSRDQLGFFAEHNGAAYLIHDIRRIRHLAEKRYPQIPGFLLGHSMGSFLVRRYLTRYGKEVDGAVLMGTGDYPAAVLLAALAAVNLTALAEGDRCRSRLLHSLVLGNYNRRIPSPRTGSDWLSRDEERVDQFVRDPYCNFRFSCSAYRDFFHVMLELKSRRVVDRMPRELPIFLMSGSEDPVGAYGKGVRRLFRRYQSMGMTDVKIRLYEGSRHEILNDLDRDQVHRDLTEWIFQQIRKAGEQNSRHI